MRQCADGIADDDPAVIENLLEFRGGFGALACVQIGQATHIDRVESAEERKNSAAWRAQLIGRGDSQQFDRLGRIALLVERRLQGEQCADRRQVVVFDCRILRKACFQILRQPFSLGSIPRQGEGKSSAILRIPVLGKLQYGHRALLCGRRIPEKGFPQCRPRFKPRRPIPLVRLQSEVHCVP